MLTDRAVIGGIGYVAQVTVTDQSFVGVLCFVFSVGSVPVIWSVRVYVSFLCNTSVVSV